MAVIRKSGRGWQVLIRKKNYSPVYKTFISKAVATNWAQETELKIEQGIFQNLEEAGRTTLKEILLSYRDNVTTKKRGHVQEATKINKLMRQDIVKNNLARLSTLKVSKFRDAWLLDHNPSTVNKYLTIISCSIDYAMQELGIYLPGNACKNVKRPREPEFSSDAIETFEEDLLIKFAADSKAVWLKAMIVLGIDCGMRRGEILKLASKDVSYETGTAVLRLTKNGEDRKIGLTPRAMEELKKLPVNIDGRLINCKNVDQFKFYWRQLRRITGVKKTFHQTRHTFCTRAGMKGWSAVEIAAQTGHRDLRVLRRYVHLQGEYLAKKLSQN